ncbi:MAG: hypothetical protein CVU43_05895 [Chloroflexi bacterium HGW-Chloroflexi-5]|jgi:superfamily I DNA/RNA helicase|nr:MAG: hypothetical protein CVU43_05895 [Chloroflexi bacterium HGW-Chloroflexi-5]
MKYIILPRHTVDRVVSEKRLGTLLSSMITQEFPEEVGLRLEENQATLGICKPIGKDASIYALWSPDDGGAIRNISAWLSIWCDPEGFNITSLDDPDCGEFLDRVCRLAHHLWNNLAFPEAWYARRINKLDSIYAGDRTLLNIRFCYSARRVLELDLLEVGSFYYARRQGRSAVVPLIDSTIVDNLPRFLEVPKEAGKLADYGLLDDSSGKASEEGDIQIGRRERDFHLFSLTYEQWTAPKGPLTSQQLKVIHHNVVKPLRVHGPAGSGKTLVLILKALYLLREAVMQDSGCHILIVVTSNAVEQTVRTAIETIDERSFLATTREDKQCLDVSTLHGWCIRELGLAEGNEYVLERDPKESRRRQSEILNKVVEEALVERYNKVKSSLCDDFIRMIEHHRETLLRELQYEIGIRIKGRGFRIRDRDLYIKNPARTFLGGKASIWDKHFIFHIYEKYEALFKEENLLDTDDVVLSMSARLSTSLWDRQRSELGYDYVFVDETHLFNDNERRVLPLLTRAESNYPCLVMSFDETQSIGGTRGLNLESVGISGSERRNLKVVHRSSPDIFALARDLVERSPLVFTEFLSEKNISKMGTNELRRCKKPYVSYIEGGRRFEEVVTNCCEDCKLGGYSRIGVIVFDLPKYGPVIRDLRNRFGSVFEIEERGDKLGALPKPGCYVMTPESCGGLEFEAVLAVGADKGCIPIPLGNISREGYQSILEEAYMELYTAITRAKYVLGFLCDGNRGISEILVPSIKAGLLEETSADNVIR